MDIICNKQLLSTAIQQVSYAVAAKSSLAALECILLKAGEGKLALSGYDLELGITTAVEARVNQPGAVLLSARLLADIVRRMPGDSIAITCQPNHICQLKSGLAEYTLPGLPSGDFPELPRVEGEATAVSLPQCTLRSMLEQVLFAVATTDLKPVHTGVLFDLDQESITLVAVDGYRLALRREQAQINTQMQFIVPGKTLSDVQKLLAESETPLSLLLSKKHIIFDIEGCQVVSRLLEGDFLDYKNAIPKESQTSVTITTRAFMAGVERTSLLISEKLKSPLKAVFESESLTLWCSTTMGQAIDQVACQMKGQPVEMGFNNRYLLDALRAADCDELRLEINGPLSPMKLLPPTGDAFLFLVLPVRLKQ